MDRFSLVPSSVPSLQSESGMRVAEQMVNGDPHVVVSTVSSDSRPTQTLAEVSCSSGSFPKQSPLSKALTTIPFSVVSRFPRMQRELFRLEGEQHTVSDNSTTPRETPNLHLVHGLEFLLLFCIVSGMVYNFMLPYIGETSTILLMGLATKMLSG